jgi:DNA modification methylase
VTAPSVEILTGDALEVLRTLPDGSVRACITSPPYFNLRVYGNDSRELGQEKTPQEYVAKLVLVFEEVRRVLKKGGNFWLVIGDSYAVSGCGGYLIPCKQSTNRGSEAFLKSKRNTRKRMPGLKNKDLIGIPWMIAFALRDAGWYLRQDICWAKPNAMPESVKDRCTRSHEYIFHFTKSQNYYYDYKAIQEPCIYDVDGTGTASRKARAHEHTKQFPTAERNGIRNGGYKNSVNFAGKNRGQERQRGHGRRHQGFSDRWDAMEREEQCVGMRNKRSVWTVAPAQFKGAHFAVYPPKLILPMVLASTKIGDTILDPFSGSGCTGQVALENGRNAILIDLYKKHEFLARKRCEQ